MNNLKTNLGLLLQSLATVETKGESTKIMANCLMFLEQTIATLEEPTEEKGEDI